MRKRKEDILVRCIKKDRRAQNELYRKYYDVMMTIAWKYTRSHEEAIELMNSGFLKVLINLKKYPGDFPFEYWLKRVVTNEVLDQLKKKTRHNEKFEPREIDKLPDVESNTRLTEIEEDKI